MSETDDVVQVPEPRANSYFEGHADAEAALAEAARTGRVHHAWLISGPRGIGKATLAYRFARRLLAAGVQGDAGGPGLFGPEEVPDDLSMEPSAPVFQRVAAGGHADVLVIARAVDEKTGRRRSEIVVGDVRRVSEFLSLTAIEGGWRVVIVDGAEDMNRNAANALLKTLEEPPPRTVILLVSHAAGRLLPTIRSRCRRLTLSPLPDETVDGLIARYRPDIAADERRALSLIGEGSVGRALTLADTGGLALYEELVRLLAGLPDPEAARLHGTLDAIARTRDETGAYRAYEVFTDLMGAWVSRQVRSRARGIEPVEIMPGEGEVARRLTGRASLDQWVEVWEKITRQFGRAARLNLDRKQVLLDAFFALGRTAA